ncbi:MAG: DUF87 domain-containing protein [Candidatus Aenigmarchaeota archaeon]|nr:DUF87 domain-containing protein [Candidatus Aenigmarchaeota archaeon]
MSWPREDDGPDGGDRPDRRPPRRQDRPATGHIPADAARQNRDGRALVHEAARLRALLEAAGVDPRSSYAGWLRDLLLLGRGDLVEKLLPPALAKAAERTAQGRVFRLPSPVAVTGPRLVLGRATDLWESGGEVALPVSALARHLGVFGQSGSGKSRLVKHLVQQAIEQGEKVWLVDPDGDYGDLCGLFPREMLWWIDVPAGVLQMNPWQAEGDPRAWASVEVGLVRSVYYLRDGAASLLSALLNEAYARRGCLHGSGEWPSTASLVAEVDRLRFAQNSKSAAWLESLQRALRSMLDGAGAALDCVRGHDVRALREHSIVFHVRGWDSQLVEYWTCTLLAKLAAADGVEP